MPERNSKDIFLPKELNKNASLPVCIDKQYGLSSTEMHWHDCAEIIHLQQGFAMMFCHEKWEKLEAPDTIFLSPGHLHCCHCTDPDAVKIVIGLDMHALPDLGLANEHALLPLQPGGFDGTMILRQFDRVAQICAPMKPDEEILGLTDSLTQVLHIQQLYCAFLEQWETKGAVRRLPPKNPVIQSMEALIDAKFAEPLTAAEAAELLHISYSHMANLLRWELGTTFGELLLQKRIDAAKRLLLTTDLSITEVGLHVGFSDTSYFIRRFSALVGTTPHKYRAENLKLLR